MIPNLDSIHEFRVLTNNFDPEYGNYNGGMINVVTKSGSNAFHGDAFEFLRNTDLDAKNYFDPPRGVFRQNQFGGTVGGPIKKDKLFFFCRLSGNPNDARHYVDCDHRAFFAGPVGQSQRRGESLTGTVSGPNIANLLTQKLGYRVTQGEPYYTPGCSTATCVFPTAMIPMSAWSAPAQNLLKYIPAPNIGSNFSPPRHFLKRSGTTKAGGRVDANTRLGQISGYYFVDDYRLDNPYPGGQGGASVPGFDALTIGRAQMITSATPRCWAQPRSTNFTSGSCAM